MDELHDQYFSPNIIMVITRKRIRLVGHVARMGTGEVRTGFWWRNMRERGYSKDLGIGKATGTGNVHPITG